MATNTNGVAVPVLNTNACCLTCVVVEVRSFQNIPFMDVGLNTIVPVQILLTVIHLPTLHHLQPLRVVPSKFLTLDFFSPFLIIFLFNKIITQDFRMKYRQRPVWFNKNLTSAKDPSFSAQWLKSSIKPTEYFEQKKGNDFANSMHYSVFVYATPVQYSLVFNFTPFRKTSCYKQRRSITVVSSLGGSRRANYCQFLGGLQ